MIPMCEVWGCLEWAHATIWRASPKGRARVLVRLCGDHDRKLIRMNKKARGAFIARICNTLGRKHP